MREIFCLVRIWLLLWKVLMLSVTGTLSLAAVAWQLLPGSFCLAADAWQLLPGSCCLAAVAW